MLALVRCQIAQFDRFSQRRGLTKREAQSFTGYSVHRSRSIADQCNVPTIDALEPAAGCHGPALRAEHCGRLKPALQFGKFVQRVIDADLRIARNRGDTHRVRSNGRHVNLAFLAPVELHVIRPWRNTVMPSESEPAAIAGARIQPGPAPHQGVFSISAD
jgi:hypothetical protein